MLDQLATMPRYEVYKDSGVEWLGEIPEHWGVKKLKNLVRLNNGLDYKHVQDVNGYPVIGSGGQFAYSTEYLYEGEAVLLGRKGTIDKPLYVNEKFWTVDTMFYAVGNKLTVMKFFFYSVTTIPFPFYSTSTALPSMTQSDLGNHKMAYPPVFEQTAIATFLDQKTKQINDAISIKEKQIDLLKERKQILIQNAVTRGLNPNAPMRDSGVAWIGEIPAHWNMLANRVLFKERVEPGREGLPLLSVSIHTGVSSEEIDEEKNIRGRVKIEDKTKYNLVEPNDIVFNMMRAWQGAIGCVKVKGMVSPAYIIAKPISKINAQFFEYQYRCPEFIQQMDRNSKGITDFRKRLYWGEFKQLATVVPPEDEQKNIIAHIKAQSNKINQAITLQQNQIDKLKEYKATLINSAVTGKIKVPECLEEAAKR